MSWFEVSLSGSSGKDNFDNYCLFSFLLCLEMMPMTQEAIHVRLSSGIMDELMDRAYVSTYDPFRELIANSYDAFASTVWVWGTANGFVVEDDGRGIGDFNSFLTKGFSEKKTRYAPPAATRTLIGEKGLGFLSVFKIAHEVDVYSRHESQTWHVQLSDSLIRTSIDSGEPILMENVTDFLAKRGTRIYLRGCGKKVSASKLYDYVCATFAPLLVGCFAPNSSSSDSDFRIFVNGRKAEPPNLPEGSAYESKGRNYEINFVNPFKVEDRLPVRFYNKGVLVKREILAKRPMLTGYVNTTDLALVTGRGAYVEDEEYQKFKNALDLFIEQIPREEASDYISDQAVRKSLNRLAQVLGNALSSPLMSDVSHQLPGRNYAVRGGDGENRHHQQHLRQDLPLADKKVIKLLTTRTRSFGASIREAALSPSDFPVMATEDSIVLNVSHPHVTRIAALPEKFRDLALMPFVAEGFVEFLGVKNMEEKMELTDKIIREMLLRI
jgi:hypothetical protein